MFLNFFQDKLVVVALGQRHIALIVKYMLNHA